MLSELPRPSRVTYSARLLLRMKLLNYNISKADFSRFACTKSEAKHDGGEAFLVSEFHRSASHGEEI